MAEPSPAVPSDDDITTTTPEQLRCPVCWTSFTRIRRQRFCSDNCRKTAWARQRTHATLAQAAQPVVSAARRRDVTVYSCPACDIRYYGQQWCPECNQPCTRAGLGGLCPHCDEPVAINDLLDPQEALRR